MNNSKFRSGQNKSTLLGILDDVVRERYHVTLNEDFVKVFDDIMAYVDTKFGKKPTELTITEHIKNINKICLDEAMKYIGQHVIYFPKINNSDKNNKAIVVKDDTKLYKSTDDLLQNMQTERNGYNQMPTQINFQLPTQLPQQPSSEQALMLALEQRKREFPSIKTPAYQPQGVDNPQMLMSQTQPQQPGNMSLMNMLLQTPIAAQYPDSLPHIITEIMQMSHLVDLMGKDPIQFQQQVTNPGFLQMILTQIKNKNDPRMRPMSLIENEKPLEPTQSLQAQTQPLTDYSKILESYKPGDQSTPNLSITDNLSNNVLPDIEQVHFIDYDVSLDFRTDLEVSVGTQTQYPLKFVKFGNISKVQMISCLIPENGLLSTEPYIYVKIEELGGKCFTSNHEVTFGKLVLSGKKNGYLHYTPDFGTCIQNFSQPITVQKFTISFLNYTGKHINLREIGLLNSFKLKKQNKLKFVTLHKHLLTKGDKIEIQFYQTREIDQYEVLVDEVIDDTTFTVDNVFDKLSEHIVIMRCDMNCSFIFKLYEINWNLLTKKNLQNAQLIKLSQLVSERRKEVQNYDINYNGEITNYVKNQDNISNRCPPLGSS